MYIDLIHDIHCLIYIITVLGTCTIHVHVQVTRTDYSTGTSYNPQQLTNNNILTMVIRFTNTSPWMITLPPTSSNRSHHTQQLSPFLEPLQLSTSRNIACPFQRVKPNSQHHFFPLVIIGNSISPIESKMKADIIDRHHQTMISTHYLPAGSTGK